MYHIVTAEGYLKTTEKGSYITFLLRGGSFKMLSHIHIFFQSSLELHRASKHSENYCPVLHNKLINIHNLKCFMHPQCIQGY